MRILNINSFNFHSSFMTRDFINFIIFYNLLIIIQMKGKLKIWRYFMAKIGKSKVLVG